MTNLRPILLPTRQDLGVQQGAASQGGMRGKAERSGIISAPNTEVLDAMPTQRAPDCKIGLVERGVAGLREIRGSRHTRTRHRRTGGPPEWHEDMYGPCHGGGPPPRLGLPDARERPRRSDVCAGRSNLV